jgi:hypothetical protein
MVADTVEKSQVGDASIACLCAQTLQASEEMSADTVVTLAAKTKVMTNPMIVEKCISICVLFEG